MERISVDFGKSVGKIKPMHAVNNGPLAESVRGTSNFDLYKEAGIPYARNHDASFYTGYGGEHTVDVHRIFKNFDADVTEPVSYVFSPTDNYVKTTFKAGTKVFYRLGASIEHGYKFGTYPPKDFLRWAQICEHIIRHYTEGWADGYTFDIEYWEIWNEADCGNPDGSNPCWQGTEDQFIEFYSIVAKYLKGCFPHLKIGGPAFTNPWRTEFKQRFLRHIKGNNIPFDFYSYHCYAKTPFWMRRVVLEGEEALCEAGLSGTETVLDEWNYVKGWSGQDWMDSVEVWKSLKGASFITGTMCACQYSPLSMLMFYDARPCLMNSLFDTDRPWVPLKGYYPFKMFNELYKLGTAVEIGNTDGPVYVAAAKGDSKAAILITYFEDETDCREKEVELLLNNINLPQNAFLSRYVLDDNNNCALAEKSPLNTNSVTLTIPLYTSILMVIE